jgi:hypothetical protein
MRRGYWSGAPVCSFEWGRGRRIAIPWRENQLGRIGNALRTADNPAPILLPDIGLGNPFIALSQKLQAWKVQKTRNRAPACMGMQQGRKHLHKRQKANDEQPGELHESLND